MFTCSKAEFQKGQSLIEVIVAGLVGILVVSALTFATIFSIRNANFAKTSAQATKLAQEGIEWVRRGRDYNSNITISGTGVSSWNGDTTGTGSVWAYQISTGCGSSPSQCFFNVDATGQLTLGSSYTPTDSQPLPSQAESINPGFKRAVVLTDDASFGSQKRATVIVTWTDPAGNHESRMETILRNLQL